MIAQHAASVLATAARNAARSPLHTAAEAHESRFEVAFRLAFSRGRVAAGRGKPNADKVVKAIAASLKGTLPRLLVKAVAEGGVAGLQMVKRPLRTAAKAPLTMRFDAKNPSVIAWAREHAAELITNITETTRDRIRNVVADFEEDGDWQAARDQILFAVGDATRAKLIARHETMQAASEGQRQAWDQATEKGLLTGNEQRVWITTPDERLCPICADLDERTASMDGSYPDGYDGPPAHVQCRCTEGLA